MLIAGTESNEEKCSNRTWFFNHQSKKWTHGPVLGTGRCCHTAGIIKNRKTSEEYVAVIGGSSNIYQGLSPSLQSVELLALQSKEFAWEYGMYAMYSRNPNLKSENLLKHFYKLKSRVLFKKKPQK